MAVTEFLEAVDKMKEEEEAAMAAAPVSAEVAPAAPSLFGTPAPVAPVSDTVGEAPVMQTPAATPQQLDQMLADPATVNVGNAPAKSVPFPNVPLEQALIQTSRDIVEYGKSGDVATNVPGTPAPVDTIAQPDVLEAAPAVQSPAQVGLPPEERARIETRLAGTNADIVASGETAPSLGVATPEAFNPVGGGFSFGGDIPIPADRESGFIPEKEEFLTGGTPVFSNQGKAPAPTPEVAPAVEMATPESVANLSVNGTDVITPEAITEAGQVAPSAVAPQTPTAGSGGMITRDSTGESFIGGSQVAATPEQVAAFNKMSLAANTDAAARERMRYNAPTIKKFQTEEQKNIAAGRPPNVSASDVQAAQEQAIRNRDILKQRKIKEREKQRKREKADEYERIDRTPGPRGSRAKAKKEVDKRFREQERYDLEQERYDLEQDRLKLNTEFEQELAAQTLSTRQKEAEALDAYRTRPAKPSPMREKLNAINDLPISQDEKNKLIYVLVGGEDYEYPGVEGAPVAEGEEGSGGTRSAIPQAAINSLLQNPSEETARYFDLKYGAGSANKIINK